MRIVNENTSLRDHLKETMKIGKEFFIAEIQGIQNTEELTFQMFGPHRRENNKNEGDKFEELLTKNFSDLRNMYNLNKQGRKPATPQYTIEKLMVIQEMKL